MLKKWRDLSLILAIILIVANICMVHGGDFDDGSLKAAYKSNFAEDRVLVKLADNQGIHAMSLYFGIDVSEIRLLNPSKEADDMDSFSVHGTAQNNIFVFTLNESSPDSVERALKMLNANPAVEIAEPDYLYELSAIPNDPLYNAQYALQKMNMEQAWDITTGNKSVVVGVIDTGIEGTHFDLKDNLWVNPNPGQNGYINDIHGYNFTNGKGGIPTDLNGHGTHVAGIIGAKGNNGEGVAGVNWDVSLAWLGAGRGNYVMLSAAIEALNYANNNGIMIVNNSYGSPDYSELFKITISNYKGLFVAGSGNSATNNDTYPMYPASYNLPNVISVASSAENHNLSYFSCYGENSVHVAAPGSTIMSTYLDGSYRELSGTSMATPQIAGIAALIKSIHPTWTPEQVKAAICQTARPVPQLSTKVKYSGVADAFGALQVNAFHSVTYNFNGGGSAPLIDIIVPGKKLIEPKSPERNGFAFIGWHTSTTGGSLFDFDTVVNQDITLYAQWVLATPSLYATEFPDIKFRREVLNLFNAMDGGDRTSTDILNSHDITALGLIKTLDVGYLGIHDITGLNYLLDSKMFL